MAETKNENVDRNTCESEKAREIERVSAGVGKGKGGRERERAKAIEQERGKGRGSISTCMHITYLEKVVCLGLYHQCNNFFCHTLIPLARIHLLHIPKRGITRITIFLYSQALRIYSYLNLIFVFFFCSFFFSAVQMICYMHF